MIRISSGSARTGRVLIHVWAGWFYWSRSIDFLHICYSCQQWSVCSANREGPPSAGQNSTDSVDGGIKGFSFLQPLVAENKITSSMDCLSDNDPPLFPIWVSPGHQPFLIFFYLKESTIACHTCLYCTTSFSYPDVCLKWVQREGEPWNTLVCLSEDKETGSCRDLAIKASIHINKARMEVGANPLAGCFPRSISTHHFHVSCLIRTDLLHVYSDFH